MIAPLVPFALKGALWYQGEANASRAAQYRRLLPELIRDWRGHFAVGDFPFLIVQLANLQKRRDQPSKSDWAELREAQYPDDQGRPNAQVALAIDIGEADEIHPPEQAGGRPPARPRRPGDGLRPAGRVFGPDLPVDGGPRALGPDQLRPRRRPASRRATAASSKGSPSPRRTASSSGPTP